MRIGGQRIILSAGRDRALVLPEIGGALAGYWRQVESRAIHWLRPISDVDSADDNVLGTACFPLVPYSNRIRRGRFNYQGRDVTLPLNFGDHPHSIHGHGWQVPWTVVNAGEAEAELSYRHEAGDWPWSYEARQRFSLSPDDLTIYLDLSNKGDTPMPAGVGFHPYFPRTAETRIQASVSDMWRVDDEVMPVALEQPPDGKDPNAGLRVDAVALDNGYTGWRGSAVISWPERSAELTMAASEELGKLVIFTPPGEDFLCVEPVSHDTDAFNRAAAGEADTGMRVLAPGENLSVYVRFTPAHL